MKKISCKIKGVCAMLHNRFPVEEHGQGKNKAKQKVFVPEEEANKALYIDDKGKVVLPSEHIFQAMIKAGVGFIYERKKTYKDYIKSGIIIEPDFLDMNKETWDEIDARAVVIQRARVVRYRPKFNAGWEVAFTITIIDDTLEISTIKDILEKAGTIGVGDYRPRFGRFQVIEFKEE